MKKFTKALALLLSVLTISAALVGCDFGKEEKTVTNETTTTTKTESEEDYSGTYVATEISMNGQTITGSQAAVMKLTLKKGGKATIVSANDYKQDAEWSVSGNKLTLDTNGVLEYGEFDGDELVVQVAGGTVTFEKQ